MNPMRATPERAFTVIETLVAIVVMVTLLSLILPVLQRVRGDQYQQTRCLTNLRETALALHLMTSDRNGIFRSFARGGGGGGVDIWGKQLIDGRYLQDRATLRCPAGASEYALEAQAWYWNTYGFNMATAAGGLTPAVGDPQVYTLRFSQVAHPGRRPMLVDSSTVRFISPGKRTQIFRVNINKVSDGIQLRHRGRALTVFMDGHIEALDREQVETYFNPQYIYDANETP